MIDISNKWTLDGFVEHFAFVHHKMLDHKFVWILGAGASFASGIPLGSELVDRWLEEIHLREDPTDTPVEDWATAETLGIPDFKFDSRASMYPKIYQRRFNDYPEEGYAYLESVMSGKDPSPGYSILAAALAKDPPRHNVVITTNFDNLVSDALSIYTDTFPFVAGHESLTGFVRVSMRRPLICKIHRDLLLGPQSDARSLKRLHDAWGMALRALFQHYTPIFIGYGGNDDTLMDLLASFEPTDIKGQPIWCYYEESEPTERIVDTVANLNGILVPVPDFDLLMVLLGERMQIGLLDEEIGRRSVTRTQRYRDRIERLDTVSHPSVTKALAATLERSGGWWTWFRKASLETDVFRKEIVFRQGISHCPDSGELLSAFAMFVWEEEREDLAICESMLRRSIELAPRSSPVLNNFGYFLLYGKNDLKGSEEILRKAVELDDGEDPAAYVNLTHVLSLNGAKAEEIDLHYQESLKRYANLAVVRAKYAQFLIENARNEEAKTHLEAARKNVAPSDVRCAAAIELYAAILARLNGEDDSGFMSRLQQLLASDTPRRRWRAHSVISAIKDKLPPADFDLFSSLARILEDTKEAPQLDDLLQQREKAFRTAKSAASE